MMRRIGLLAGRELWSAAVSPATWGVFAAAWLYMGWRFYDAVRGAGGADLRGLAIWLSGLWLFPQLVLAALVCMRLLSEERRTGTFETLVTAPVHDVEIVLGKFLAAATLVGGAGLIVPALLYLTAPFGGRPDPGQLASAMLATLGACGVLSAVGLFLSALTASVLLAGFLSVFVNLGLVLLPGQIAAAFSADHFLRRAFSRGSLPLQVEEGAQGIFDVNNVAYQVVMTALFLLFATRALEARKWR